MTSDANPADTVIEQAAQVALDAMETKQRADKEAVRAALGDLAVDLDGKEHDYRVEAWEVARALHDAGLLADPPAERDEWLTKFREAQAEVGQVRQVCREVGEQWKRAEAEVAELREKVEELRLIANVNGDWNVKYDQLRRERDELRATIDRVRAIHEPIDAVMNPGARERIVKVCTGCGTDDGNWQRWPCPTVRALDGAGEQHE